MAKLALHWPVCVDGYKLVWRGGEDTAAANTLAGGARYQSIVRNSERLRADIDIMQIPALYGRLAHCEPTAEGALAFVNKYGFLTKALRAGKPLREEPADVICHQIRVMRALLALKHTDDQNALDNWFTRNGETIRLNVVLKKGQSPRLFFEPVTLIDAIYLQFFQDLETGANIRRCARPGCGEWFHFGPGTDPPRRSTVMYCSRKCQSAHAYAKTKGDAS